MAVIISPGLFRGLDIEDASRSEPADSAGTTILRINWQYPQPLSLRVSKKGTVLTVEDDPLAVGRPLRIALRAGAVPFSRNMICGLQNPRAASIQPNNGQRPTVFPCVVSIARQIAVNRKHQLLSIGRKCRAVVDFLFAVFQLLESKMVA